MRMDLCLEFLNGYKIVYSRRVNIQDLGHPGMDSAQMWSMVRMRISQLLRGIGPKRGTMRFLNFQEAIPHHWGKAPVTI